MNTTKPMDVYSSHSRISFNVAAYCRGHKLSVEAVLLARAINRVHAAEYRVVEAQKVADAAAWDMESALLAVKQKMDRDPL